ncbi:MAG: Rieske 2Fe-2S domain-containing protein [Polyangiaceae bacterium]|nr:Rieske 2Fe-2S domain-containing protein [Polyangiaceae bacterium]
MTYRRVMKADDLWEGETTGVVVGDTPVLLANVGGVVRAYADRCAHQGVALSRVRPAGKVLTCWAHGWKYDLLTGEGLNPRGVALTRFPLKIEEGEIWVDVDA